MKRREYTPEEMKQRLDYNPETGALTWKKLRAMSRVGEQAKSLDVSGYIQVMLPGAILKGHRIAWAIFYGGWPKGHIDHINGIRNDNRIENLRIADLCVNAQNKRLGSCKNETGYLGVHINKKASADKRYRAKIMKDGKQHHLGGFPTPELAYAAYVEAKRVMHEGCAI